MTISGPLVRDPEVKQSQSGTSLCRITVVSDSGWGDNKESTFWHCTMFGKRGETAAKFFRKGRWITVMGEVKMREYARKDGTPGFSADVTVSDWSFCGPKVDDGNQSSGGDDGDIPF